MWEVKKEKAGNDTAMATLQFPLFRKLSVELNGPVIAIHHYGKDVEAGVRGTSAYQDSVGPGA